MGATTPERVERAPPVKSARTPPGKSARTPPAKGERDGNKSGEAAVASSRKRDPKQAPRRKSTAAPVPTSGPLYPTSFSLRVPSTSLAHYRDGVPLMSRVEAELADAVRRLSAGTTERDPMRPVVALYAEALRTGRVPITVNAASDDDKVCTSADASCALSCFSGVVCYWQCCCLQVVYYADVASSRYYDASVDGVSVTQTAIWNTSLDTPFPHNFPERACVFYNGASLLGELVGIPRLTPGRHRV